MQKLSGKVVALLPERSFQYGQDQKEGHSQEFIIEWSETYGENGDRTAIKHACIEIFGTCAEKNILSGMDLDVNVDIQSREYQGKWYTKIKYISSVLRNPAETTAAPQAQAAPTSENPDDLPF